MEEEEVLQAKSPDSTQVTEQAPPEEAPATEETVQPNTKFSAKGPIPRVMGDETGQRGGVTSLATRSASERGFDDVVHVADGKVKLRE